MCETRRLRTMPYAQARIEVEDGVTTLVSYNTRVAAIVGSHLLVGGLYSATTRKHISAFCREYGLNYYIAKKCYEEGKTYNMINGQYEEIGS